jgi:hypothetical protein
VDRSRFCQVIYYFDTPALGIKHQLFDCVSMEGSKFIFGRDKIVMLNIESFPDSLGFATAPRFFFHVLNVSLVFLAF